jgi:PAS domain S-box-containing protein
MLVFDLEGRLQRLNAAGRELVGLAEAEVAGTPLLELVHPSDRDALGERLAALRAGDSPRSARGSASARRTARTAWLETRTIMERESQLLFAVARDLSGSEDADAERAHRVLHGRAAGHGLVTPDGCFRRANPALCRLLGRTTEELLESTIFEVVADEQAAMTEWSASGCETGERSGFQAETRLRRPDGGSRWPS